MKKLISALLIVATVFALASCATAAAEQPNVYDTTYPGKVLDETTGATYDTLADALAAAGEGDTIIMCKDETVDATVRISKPVTLDFNGHTLTGTNNGATLFVRSLDSKATLENVTIKNGTVTGYPKGAGTSSLFGFVMVRNVLVENMTIVSNVQANEDEACAFYVNGTQMVANNLTVVGKTVCYNKSNGTIDLVINGGTFVKDPNCPKDNIIKICGDSTENAGSVLLNDVKMTGEFEVGSNPPVMKVAGGSFSFKVSSYYIADGYKCVQSGDVYNIVLK